MKILRFLAVLVGLGVAGLAGVYFWLQQPYKGFDKEAFIKFEHGTGTKTMAAELEKSGVIRNSWQFMVARMLNPDAKLQAGEYRFDQAASPLDVFRKISKGDVYHFEFTAPEGSNMFDIAKSLEEDGIFKADDFLKAARDSSMIKDLAPKATSLEGFLFPSTYRLTHSTSAQDLCRMMTSEFRKHWRQLTGGAARDPQPAVTLASLVEKETGNGQERPIVASVFANRLSQGIKLDCDPTTIYAAMLDHRYNGKIHRSDLDSENPYNTYKHPGLPPGPIANPGAAAIEAALHPAETNFLYFVAKPGGGGHNFSSTLAQHSRAVAEYRAGAKHAETGNKH